MEHPTQDSPAGSLRPAKTPWATGWGHGSGFSILSPFYVQKVSEGEDNGRGWTMDSSLVPSSARSEAALSQRLSLESAVLGPGPTGFLVSCG